MAHDVFISYRSTKYEIARKVKEALQGSGISCWMAPENISLGSKYSGAVLRAIKQAKIVLLVFSADANSSEWIPTEIERAVNYRRVIVVCRIEDAMPADDLEMLLSSRQWFSAFPLPVEGYLDTLAGALQATLEQLDAPAEMQPTKTTLSALVEAIPTSEPSQAETPRAEVLAEVPGEVEHHPVPSLTSKHIHSKLPTAGTADKAHDVFICYTIKDNAVANAICATLEDRGIRCWIAPRDVPAGGKWSSAILDALHKCKALVLVFSSSANESPQVEREVEAAVQSGMSILPFRVETADPTGSFAYFLENRHWLDAMTPPLETHLDALTERVNLLLNRQPPERVPPFPAPDAELISPPPPTPRRRRKQAADPPAPIEDLKGREKKRSAPKAQPASIPEIKPTVMFTLTGHSLAFWGDLFSSWLSAPLSGVFSVAFSPDGQRLATGSSDHTAKLWDASNGKLFTSLNGHNKSVFCVAFSPDSQYVATGSSDHAAKLWHIHTSGLFATLTGHTDAVTSVAFSSNGQLFATGSRDKTAKLWDLVAEKSQVTLTGHDAPISSVAFSPDSKRLATGSNDNTARTWDTDSGNSLVTFSGHASPVTSVVFSPDGRWIATGSGDKTAKIWGTDRGKCLVTLAGHTNWVRSIAFSPDGKLLATGSDDYTAKLWDTGSGKLLATLPGNLDVVNAVAFSPDGKCLGAGYSNNTARIWKLR